MKKGGAALAGPIWNKFITEALKNLPEEKFEPPDLEVDPLVVKPVLRGSWMGNENFFIDKISGKLAGEFTPAETIEEKVVTNVHSILYWVDKKDITGPPPENPSSDSQFNHWEVPVQSWWAQNKNKYRVTSASEKPDEVDDVHVGTSKPIVSIIEPNDRTIYKPDQKIKLKILSSGPSPLKEIDIFINNVYLETVEAPFNFSFTPSLLEDLKSNNELTIVAHDEVYNRSEVSVEFEVEEE